MKRHSSIVAVAIATSVILLLTAHFVSARFRHERAAANDSEPQKPSSVTINVYDNYFQPPILLVKPGTTVRWVNQGHHEHTLVTRDGREYPLPPGSAFELTFVSPGRFDYYCGIHTLHRMEGTIHIMGVQNEPDAQSQTMP